ncbi:MATE family efflux transporter [Halovenus sp. WSH3]|uniref:MATE family efflux transporter n=1 Tax=Halovenus carboxidivorans TaxID=2692199 RepID=A0A6B0T8H3_9EURY|nr:MATE family efflux transporter [Halovenus carboxidivorans]MXR51511.1 MATE family efflux transporter [Halovenus carboxidivorans]
MFKGPDELELTSGDVGMPLFWLSLPIVITNLLQTAYNLVDTFWLGQYSTTALAAISFGFPLVFLFISFGLGLSVAGSVLVAQNTGAGDSRQAEYAASQTILFSFVLATVLGVAGYFVVGDLLRLFGAAPATQVAATSYLQVITLGLPLMFGFLVFISLMRGYGDTVTPMLVMFGSVVLNIALDPFLIFGWTVLPNAPLVGTISFPELGIQGAAYATVFSRGVAMVVGLAIMFRGNRGVKIRLSDMRPDLAYFRKILRIGVPASIEGTGRAISVNALLVVVGGFSTVVVAGYGIGIRIFSVIFLPAIAVSQGVETMVGQNVGAERVDRASTATQFAAKWMFVLLGGLGVLIFLLPRPIAAVFTNDPAVVDIAAEFLRYVALTFGFIGVMRAYTGAFRGAGHTLMAAVVAVSFLGFIRLPVAAILAYGVGPAALTVAGQTVAIPELVTAIGPTGIWWGFIVSNIAGAVIAYAWFRRGTWKSGDVRGPAGDAPGAGSDSESEPSTGD